MQGFLVENRLDWLRYLDGIDAANFWKPASATKKIESPQTEARYPKIRRVLVRGR